jgi:hypothetical protein
VLALTWGVAELPFRETPPAPPDPYFVVWTEHLRRRKMMFYLVAPPFWLAPDVPNAMCALRAPLRNAEA